MKKKRMIFYTLLALFCFAPLAVQAQHAALKTNVLSWASASPSLGVEIGLAQRWTLDLYGQLNPLSFGQKRWKHWLAQPEARFWFCEKFHGHFLGLHAVGGEFNIGKVGLPFGIFDKTEDSRFQGWGAGGGVTYGYQWLLSRHWNLETSIGVGYIYTEFDRFPCATCGYKLDSGKKNYVGLTKAAISLIYVF